MYDETVSNVILCQLKHGLDYFLHSVELIFKLRTVTYIQVFPCYFNSNSFPFDITKYMYEPISNRKILFKRKNLQKGLLSSKGYMHCIINLKLTIIIVQV